MTTTVAERLLDERRIEPVMLAAPVPLREVPTPALLLDRAALARNVRRMADFLSGRGKGFRPHTKTHKCPLLARLQLDAGAVGVCAAKVSEAYVLHRAGISPILVTSPVTAADRAELLASMAAAGTDIQVVVDSEHGLELLTRAAARHDAVVTAFVDLDPDMGRTGIRDHDRAAALAAAIAEHDRLRFGGLQLYAGHVMHVAGFGARRERSLRSWQRALAVTRAIAARGHDVPALTGGGTGTYDIDCEVAAVTDLQVGSYVFMDQEYRDIGGRGGAVFDDFEVALTVLATVISRPSRDAVTVDCGYKGFASDSVAPVPLGSAGGRYRFAGDEHGVLMLEPGSEPPPLGSVVEFVVPHCDPTVNLYDYYWVHEQGLATELWPVAARGCSW